MLNTEHIVKNTLASTLNFSNISSVQNHHRLRDDLQLDSMGSLMFLMRLEENIEGFFVDPENLEMRDLETVSSVVRYVNSQILSEDIDVH